jgi:protein-tyrosine phosphatase
MVDNKHKISVLFVCMGNICRSPTAEAVFRHLLPQLAPELDVAVDSAATHAYHLGAAPDPRMQAVAQQHGIDMSQLRARRLLPADFERFDWIIVMDENNRRDARALAPASARARLCRLLDFAPEQELRDVPDPYYGDPAQFALVLSLVDLGVRGLIQALRTQEPTLVTASSRAQ